MWELSPRKGTKKNFWRQELVSGLILSLSHHVFFKKSSCTLHLHFNKHPKLLKFLHVTCWFPAQTFIKWKKTYRKQEKQERLNRQDILPSNSSSFLVCKTWVMLVHIDFDPGSYANSLLNEERKMKCWVKNPSIVF